MAITSELGKLKINCKFEKNKLIIEKKEKINSNVVFSSHNDHRIVMALAILATINEGKSIICDAECVTKSYPDFFNDLKSLNANLYSF